MATTPTTPQLFQLPSEIAQVLNALLERDELDQLRTVCRASASSASYQRLDARTRLILPVNDQPRARRMVSRICADDPSRLARFKWITIASAAHVELLQDLGVSDAVTGVCVRGERLRHTEVDDIVDRLTAFPNLVKLDLSKTFLHFTGNVAKLVQLRELDLSDTRLQTANEHPMPLAALKNLEVLLLRDVYVTDLSFVENMTALRRLEATRAWDRKALFPSCRALTNLHTLRVGSIEVSSMAEFADSLPHLKHLLAGFITPVDPNIAFNKYDLTGFQNLETIQYGNTTYTPSIVRIPTLRKILHRVQSDTPALAGLEHLEHLGVRLKAHICSTMEVLQDYQYLLRLTRLTSVTVDQMPDWRVEYATAEADRFFHVLTQLPYLERLTTTYNVQQEVLDAQFPRFTQLKHLTFVLSPTAASLHWIESLQALRSLSAEIDLSVTDVSSISKLRLLEDLRLTNTASAASGQDNVSFLAPLVKLRSLSLSGYLSDLRALRDLVQLRTLRIVSRHCGVMKNQAVIPCWRQLRELDIRDTTITDLRPLLALPFLRSVAIATKVDCRQLSDWRWLAGRDHPSLVYVLHPVHNCLWSAGHRQQKSTMWFGEEEGHDRRSLQSIPAL